MALALPEHQLSVAGNRIRLDHLHEIIPAALLLQSELLVRDTSVRGNDAVTAADYMAQRDLKRKQGESVQAIASTS